MPWSAIRTNGWRQGNFLNESCTPEVLEQCGQSYHPNSRLILLSHDCDIVYKGNSEPNAEVCVAEPLDGDLDGNYTHGKNPRILHIGVGLPDTPRHFEIHASKRLWIDRKILLDHTPDDLLTLGEKELDTLIGWVVNKFNRAAFPDTFNERLGSSLKDIQKVAKKDGGNLSGIYLALSTFDELDDGQDYQVLLVGLMEPDRFSIQELRTACVDAMSKISTKIDGCSGIGVEDYEVRSEDAISLHDFRQLARFPLDYLTYRQA